MTGHSALPDAGTYAGGCAGKDTGKHADRPASGTCGPLSFAAGPAPGAGIARPAGVPRGTDRGKYSFTCKIVDNLLNNTANIQRDLVSANS